MKPFRNSALALSLIGLAVVATPSAARPQRLIHVPGDYTTITAALSAASSGDTVQVAAGTYAEGNLHIPVGVALVGAGWQTTTIDGGGAVDAVVYPANGSTVEGFTVQGSGPDYFDCGVWVDQGTITIRDTRLTGNAAGLWAWCFDAATCAINITLEHNLIVSNSRSGVSSNEYPVFTLRNNTVADNGADGVTLNHASSLAENNLIVGNATTGLANHGGAMVRHNDVWGNGQDYGGDGPGTGDLSLDPLFRDAHGGDYRLYAGSPAVGHGTPPGTDMGALPFTPVGTPPTGLAVTAVDTFTWELSWAGSSAAGYAVYLGTAEGFYTRRFDAGTATTYPLSGLPGGLTYYAAVSAYDAAGDESLVTAPVSFAVPAAPNGLYEEDSPAVALTGDWTHASDGRASGGGYAVSTTAGDTVQFTFNGESVALYRLLDTDGGRATVTIDGASYGTLEFYFNETRWQALALYDGLGAGIHALTLRVSANTHNNSTGHAVVVDAFAVPSPYPPTPEQDAALERVNWHRQIAGIPLVTQDGALNRAAQVHAEYAVIYHDAHHETPGTSGFIGEWPSERAAYFGYSGGVGEDMHGIGDPVGAVDGWMETVYHRNLIMGYGFAEMGYGLAVNSSYASDVLDMASRDWSGPAPNTRFIYTYPADGQTDAPHIWGGGEAPDPLPGVPKPVGYPVSLYIAQSDTQQIIADAPAMILTAPQSPDWAVTVAELRDAGGQLVPAYVLHQDTDPNGMGADVVFLIAHSPLTLGATYTAHIAGSDSRDQSFDHTWTFITQVAASIQWVSADVGACGAQVGWSTAGEATTRIEYGTTSAYGMQLPGESAAGTSHGATLTGLAPETTYHYRIVSQDTQGHTRTTEDRTFPTRAPRVAAVPGDYATIAAALAQASYCDGVQVAAGAYAENGLTVPDGVYLHGAGWEQTTLAGNGTSNVLTLSPGSEVEGFTIQGSGTDYFHAGVWVDRGPVTLRDNRITGNATGVWAWCFDVATCALQVTLEGNLITGNARDGLDSNEFAVFTVRNNTVVDNGGRGMTLNNAASLAENNLAVGNGTGIANNAGATVQYNLSWDNGTNYSGAQGTGNLMLDPFFRNRDSGDYRLYAGSPAVGHGTPPGTDMGALPFTPVGNPPEELTVSAAGEDVWRVSWTGNGATGYVLYIGDAPGLYTHYVDVGAAMTYDLTGLILGHVYYLTVSRYDAVGDESAVAPEVAYTASSLAAPESVTLLGPGEGLVGQTYTFQAVVGPANTRTPLTYTWQTAGQTVVHAGGLTDTVTLVWGQPGVQTITVTVANQDGEAQGTLAFPVHAPLTGVQITGPTQAAVGTPMVFTATVAPLTALTPITYTWQTAEQTLIQVGEMQTVAVLTWLLPGVQTVTVTAQNLAGVRVATHTLTLHLAAVTRVVISGPAAGHMDAALRFTATTILGTALLPNTYIWEATDHAPVTHTATVRDTLSLTWATGERKLITVTVKHLDGTLVLYDQATHTVTIAEAQRIYLPLVLRRQRAGQ